MIYHPKLGQSVEVWYGAKKRRHASAQRIRWHAHSGIVVIVPRGPGPRNVGVRFGDEIVVVPRGNLR